MRFPRRRIGARSFGMPLTHFSFRSLYGNLLHTPVIQEIEE